MKSLHKKIGVGVLAVGLLVSGGFSQSIINASAYSSLSSEGLDLDVELSPQRLEDLKSMIRLGQKIFKVLAVDPDVNHKKNLLIKSGFKEKSLKSDAFIKDLRQARDLSEGEALKKLDLNSKNYYLLKFSDGKFKDEVIDDLEILIYVF